MERTPFSPLREAVNVNGWLGITATTAATITAPFA